MGGAVNMAFRFIHNQGLPTAECVAYHSADGTTRACPTECDDGSELKLTKGPSDPDMVCVGEKWIKDAIYTNGPIATQFEVYEDFVVYSGGIYQHVYGQFFGNHAVSILGYGEENGVKYWFVRNTWGEEWGENGYFRYIRGVDEGGFEDECYTIKFD